jgi:hypothetical protein
MNFIEKIINNEKLTLQEIEQIKAEHEVVEMNKKLDWDNLMGLIRVGCNSSWEKHKNGGEDPKEYITVVGQIISLREKLQSIIEGKA